MRDTNLNFHDGTNFTATTTPVSTTRSGGSAVLNVGKTGNDGLWIELAVPNVITGTTPTIDCKIQASDSPTFASGIEDLSAWPQILPATGAAFRRVLKVVTKRIYMRIVMTVGGTLTNSGGLTTSVVSGPQRDDLS